MSKEDNMNLGFSDENILKQEIEKNNLQNLRAGTAEVRLIGDKSTLISVIKLLAYIRNAIKNQKQMNINVQIGQNLVSSDFLFDVNGFEVGDYIAKDVIQIN